MTVHALLGENGCGFHRLFLFSFLLVESLISEFIAFSGSTTTIDHHHRLICYYIQVYLIPPTINQQGWRCAVLLTSVRRIAHFIQIIYYVVINLLSNPIISRSAH